ncbi:MAG: 5'/3'-nucleotidase SurE [Vampirovibrionales bacterium]|nr:5'/3'-nucleotidase SurE [Vampirovibrionales bacterium]
MLRVLLANDDGIYARGLQTLAKTLAERPNQFEVFVSAPDRERSATGHALTLHKPLRVEPFDLSHLGVKDAYSVTGTPSDCVKIALSQLFKGKIDVVVSGINHGANLGADVLYSGTVSAAIEGAMYQLPSIAISLLEGHEPQADFTHGATFIADFLETLTHAHLPPKSIFNINIPPVARQDFNGVRVTKLGTHMYKDAFDKRLDPRGGAYYWLAGERPEPCDDTETDIYAIRTKAVTISPVQFDLTHFEAVKTLKPLLEKSSN